MASGVKETTNNLSLYTAVLVVICHSFISLVCSLAYNYLHCALTTTIIKLHSLQKRECDRKQ